MAESPCQADEFVQNAGDPLALRIKALSPNIPPDRLPSVVGLLASSPRCAQPSSIVADLKH